MRQLNENEKSIIKTIVQAKNLNEHSAVKLIHDYVNASVISWDDNYQYIEIYDDSSQEDTIGEKFAKLLEIVFLFDYLSHNMYIGIYSRSNTLNAIYSRFKYIFNKESCILEKKTSPGSTDLVNTICHKIDTTLSKKVCEYANSYFFVSESLKELVKNDFKTEEQIRFETQITDNQDKHDNEMRIAKTTLFWTRLAFVLALIPAISSIVCMCSDKEKNILEVKHTKLYNDTIKTTVVSPSLNNSTR